MFPPVQQVFAFLEPAGTQFGKIHKLLSLLSGKILILSCNYWIFYVLWHNFSFSI